MSEGGGAAGEKGGGGGGGPEESAVGKWPWLSGKPAMAECPYPACGAAVPTKAKFCPSCGGILVYRCCGESGEGPGKVPELRVSEARHCSECGKAWYAEGLAKVRAQLDATRQAESFLNLSSQTMSTPNVMPKVKEEPPDTDIEVIAEFPKQPSGVPAVELMDTQVGEATDPSAKVAMDTGRSEKTEEKPATEDFRGQPITTPPLVDLESGHDGGPAEVSSQEDLWPTQAKDGDEGGGGAKDLSMDRGVEVMEEESPVSRGLSLFGNTAAPSTPSSGTRSKRRRDSVFANDRPSKVLPGGDLEERGLPTRSSESRSVKPRPAALRAPSEEVEELPTEPAVPAKEAQLPRGGVEVRLLVLVPDDVFRRGQDKVRVAFSHSALGSWKTDAHPPLESRGTVKVDGVSFHLHTTAVSVPRSQAGCTFQYKYLIEKGDDVKWVDWEFLHQKSNGYNPNRQMRLSEEERAAGLSVVVDGYLELKEPPNIQRRGFLAALSEQAGHLFGLTRGADQPIFKRTILYNSAAFKFFLPKLTPQGLEVGWAEKGEDWGPAEWLRRLNVVMDSFKNRFWNGRAKQPNLYARVFLEEAKEWVGQMVSQHESELSEGAWPVRVFAALVLLAALANDQLLYDYDKRLNRDVTLNLLNLLRIPTSASSESVEKLKTEIRRLSEDHKTLFKNRFNGSGVLGSVDAALARVQSMAWSGEGEDPVAKGILTALPIVHMAYPPPFSLRGASEPAKDAFWCLPLEKRWRRPGSSVKDMDLAWLRRMQELDPHFVRSGLFVLGPTTGELVARELQTLAPLDVLAWTSREIASLKSSHEIEIWSDGLGIVSQAAILSLKKSPDSFEHFSPREAEEIGCLYAQALKAIMAVRGKTRGRLDLQPEVALQMLASAFGVLDALSAHPSFAAQLSVSENIRKHFDELLDRFKWKLESDELPMRLVEQLMGLSPESTGVVADAWKAFLLRKLNLAPMPGNFEELLEESISRHQPLEELGRLGGLGCRDEGLREALGRRTEVLLDGLVGLATDEAQVAALRQRLEPGRLAQSLSALVGRNWPHDPDPDKLLLFLLSWTPLRAILNFGYENLSADCRDKVEAGLKLLEGRLENMLEGNAELGTAEILLAKRNAVVALRLQTDSFFNALQRLVDYRDGQAKEPLSLKKKAFILDHYFPTTLSVRPKELGELTSVLALDTRAQLSAFGRLQQKQDGQWRFRPRDLGLQAELDVSLRELEKLMGNELFGLCWERERAELCLDADTLGRICERLLKRALDRAKDHGSSFVDGNVSASDAARLIHELQTHVGGSADYLSKGFLSDLTQLAGLITGLTTKGLSQKLRKRKEQLAGLRVLAASTGLLRQIHSTAAALEFPRVVRWLEETMAQVEGASAESPLKRVDLEALRQARAALEPFEGRQELLSTHLAAFHDAQDLFVWAKAQFAKDGEPFKSTDLDTFIELAGSGEDVEKSGLVRDFEKCLEAFGPLVFELPEDPDGDAFVGLLGSLSESLEKCPNAGAKLRGVLEERARLEGLLDSALSMEKSKVDLMLAILETGHLEVRCQGRLDVVTPDTLLRAHFKSGDAAKSETMDLGQLKDLHSNLLIIAAQMKDEKEVKTKMSRFSALLDSAMRLASLFVEHWQGGNLFLASVRCRFYLERGCEIPAVLEFLSDGELSGQLRLNGKRGVQEEMDALCLFLHRSRETWLDFVRSCRHCRPTLDLFTNRQIVRLRQKLAEERRSRAAGKDGLDLELEMLLSLVKPDISAADLERVQAEVEAERTVRVRAELCPAEEKGEKRRALMEEVVEMGYTLQDAARALLHCGRDADATELVLWLREQAEEPMDTDQDAPVSQAEQIRSLVTESLEASEAEGTLDARLERMFRLYLDGQEKKDQRLVESVGICELGAVLNGLAQMRVEVKSELELPSWMEAGRQNLAVVREAEVLAWALSVYERSLGAEPTTTSVLVCAPTTTEEEVELFVRRMTHAANPSLYAFLFVECLSSQTAQTLDRLVRAFVDGAGPRRFGLLFLCSQEHYETSHLAGLLTRFRRSLPEKGWPLTLRQSREVMAKRLSLQGREGQDSLLNGTQAALVTSVGYGQGKSLAVSRLSEAESAVHRVPIHDRSLDYDLVWQELMERLADLPADSRPPLVHLDVSDHRTSGMDRLLFQLLVLGGFSTPKGRVWRLRRRHRFVVEMTSASNAFLELRKADEETEKSREAAGFRFALPLVQCHSPALTLELLRGRLAGNAEVESRGLDEAFAQSVDVERCVRYLRPPRTPLAQLGPADRLALLLEKCGRTEGGGGVQAPSWLELTNFVRFLGHQLRACEGSSICQSGALEGFVNLVVFFSVEMARDFATRSLTISEEVASLESADAGDLLGRLESYSVKRKWERNPHPYLFFNPDLQTFSFFGCVFCAVESKERQNWLERVDLLNPKSGRVLRPNVMKPKLYIQLDEQLHAHESFADDLSKPFDEMERETKLRKLYSVLVPEADELLSAGRFPDPEPDYELTMDCALKILAMEMRFRCGIPVVVMGETGCGKTRLLQFYAQVKRLRSPEAQNLLILRVHGGTDAQRIKAEVAKAKDLSARNWDEHQLDTILFLDEANTTREMCLVKEVVLERSLLGRPIEAPHLLFAIALNPYKRHTDKAIQKLESAGLGYHVQDLELVQKFDDGTIPMRQLVYRVHPLPPSLVPLAWDFGFLATETEDIYIHQMTERSLCRLEERPKREERERLARLLCEVQHFFRKEEGESSFVSLRNVERALKAFAWFLGKDKLFFGRGRGTSGELKEAGAVGRAAVLAVGLCYRSSLAQGRRQLDRVVREALELASTGVVGRCVDFVSAQFVSKDVRMETRVAKNEALRENVFVMAVTAQLGIPLFLVGKPGSSKSLGKTILTENMKGERAARGTVYQELKDVRFVSYQCSPLSTAEGVAAVFRECARQQRTAQREGKSLAALAVLPVLDEVGMAEESEKMPLKALHGLLEEGSAGLDGEPAQDYHRTGFVGISNWALDPAKMNRGIFLSRALPDHDQLVETARCICDPDSSSFRKIHRFIEPLTKAYLEVYRAQDEDYEFYGLRDFYSMMKQLAEVGAEMSLPSVSPTDVVNVIQHNFSGQLRSGAFEVFARELRGLMRPGELELRQRSSVKALVREALAASPARPGRRHHFKRFLLLLTQNNAALRLLHSLPELANAELIFGSRFPQDLEYTQICRDINRIRLCMEQGRPVILLNLETLYESLYDLLNQSFVEIRGDLVVDIGLGTHRHRTKVHADFRLVVVAELDEVRRCFPSALVNRLEKLAVFLHSDMGEEELEAADRLRRWAESAAQPAEPRAPRCPPEDVFVGYSAEETPFALVAEAGERGESLADDVLRRRLLQTAVPEGVLRVRHSHMALSSTDDDPAQWALDAYFAQGSSHLSLRQFLPSWLSNDPLTQPMLQLTTYQAQLLSDKDKVELSEVAKASGVSEFHVSQLEEFGTDAAFATAIGEVFRKAGAEGERSVVLVQCLAAQRHRKLLASCAHRLGKLRDEHPEAPVFVALVHLLHRLPFQLNDRVAKWAASDLSQFLSVSSQKGLSEGPDLESLAAAAGVHASADVHFVERLEETSRQRSLAELVEKALLRAEDGPQLIVVQFNHREERQPAKTAGDVRAEMGKLMEGKERLSRRVKVVLVTTLASTLAFPGRGWDSWHLDSLVQDTLVLPDLPTIRSTPPSQLFSRSADLGFDAVEFLRRCAVEAAALIKGPQEHNSRRVSQLVELMTKERAREEVRRRIGGLMEETEAQMASGTAEEWVYREAKNARSLVESGSFERALLKELEMRTSPLLAGLMSTLDAHSNLALSLAPQAWKTQLWQELLEDASFVPLRFNSPLFVTDDDFRSAKTEFSAVEEGWEASFPFSWLVAEQVEALLAAEREVGGETESAAGQTERHAALDARLLATSWGAAVKDRTKGLRERRDALVSYVLDIVHLRLPVQGLSEKEVRLVLEAVHSKASEARLAGLCVVLSAHVALEEVGAALRRFASLTREFPGLSEALGDRLFGREPLDVALAKGVLEFLSAPFLGVEQLEQAQKVSPFFAQVKPLTLAGPEVKNKEWLGRRRADVEEWAWRLTAAISAGLPGILAAAPTPQTEFLKIFEALKVAHLFFLHTADSPVFFSAAPIFRKLKDVGAEPRSLKVVKTVMMTLKVFDDKAFKGSLPTWEKCAECGRKLKEQERVTAECLPCLHPLHPACLQTLLQRGTQAFCPSQNCGKPLGTNWREEAGRAKAKARSTYEPSHRGLRNFFLDFLGEFLFAGSVPPSTELVAHLLDLTMPTGAGSRSLSPVPEAEPIDRSPVLRASILQHLLRYDSQNVADQLTVYYQRSQALLETEQDRQSFLNMCVRCVEDGAERELLQGDAQQPRELWQHGLDLASSTAADDVTRTGRTKAGVSLLSRLLPESKDCPGLAAALGGDAAKLSFLVRSLVHQHGLQPTAELLRRPELVWITQELHIDISSTPPAPDVFLIYGDEYASARKTFLQTSAANGSGVGDVKKLSLAKRLALVKVVGGEESGRAALGFPLPRDEVALTEQLLQHIATASDQDGLGRGLGEVFAAAARNPASLRRSFLLTMPEDKTAAVLAAVRAVAGGEQTSLNQCPNGHPYLIGDCGMPNQNAFCKEAGCGLPIGGMGHRAVQGNQALQAGDQTKRGLCLPLPQGLAVARASERDNLGSLESTIIRVLQHLSLLVAAKTQPEAVLPLFTAHPPAPAELQARLRQYIRRELRGIEAETGRNVDEVAYLLHLVIQRLCSDAGRPELVEVEDPLDAGRRGRRHRRQPRRQEAVLARVDLALLSSKQGRDKYEQALVTQVVQPVLKELDTRLGQLRQSLLADTFHGDNALLRFSFARQEGSASVWAVHRPASLPSLTRDLFHQIDSLPTDAQPRFRFLRHFFQALSPLSSLRHLPDIVRLQSVLKANFQRSLSLQELSNVSIGEFLRQLRSEEQREKVEQLLPAFFAAYKECLSHSGESQIVHSAEGSEPLLLTLPRKDVNWAALQENPLELILPIPLQSRLCMVAFALPRLLVRIQNDFLEQNRDLVPAKGLREMELSEALGREGLLRVEPERRVLPSLLLFRKLETVAGSEEAKEATTFHLEELQRRLSGEVKGRARVLEVGELGELELSRERQVRCQRRLAEAGEALSAVERTELVRAFGRAEPGALGAAVAALELLCQFLKGGERESVAVLGQRVSPGTGEALGRLGGVRGTQAVDAWTTLRVEEALERRRRGSEAGPLLPACLQTTAFSSAAAEAEVRSLVEGGGLETGPLHRLLTRFLLLYAGRAEQEAGEGLQGLLGRALVAWVSEEMGPWEDEGRDALSEVPFDLLVPDLLPLWHLLSEHRLSL